MLNYHFKINQIIFTIISSSLCYLIIICDYLFCLCVKFLFLQATSSLQITIIRSSDFSIKRTCCILSLFYIRIPQLNLQPPGLPSERSRYGAVKWFIGAHTLLELIPLHCPLLPSARHSKHNFIRNAQASRV